MIRAMKWTGGLVWAAFVFVAVLSIAGAALQALEQMP